MGHIASLSIPAYLQPDARVAYFDLADPGHIPGTPTGHLSAIECTALAERGLIHGVGSERRLRHVVLQCSLDDALIALQQAKPMNEKGSIRSAASRTTRNEVINGTQRTFRAMQHTGKRSFAPLLRQQYS